MLREGGTVFVTSQIVGFRPVTSHWNWLEVVERPVTLLDNLYGEIPSFVSVPPKFIAGFDIETSAEFGRDRDHSSIADRGFLGSFFSRHTQQYKLTHHTCCAACDPQKRLFFEEPLDSVVAQWWRFRLRNDVLVGVVHLRSTKPRALRLRSQQRKRTDETFSEAIDRLTGQTSLLGLSGLLTDEEAAEIRESLRERDDDSRRRLDRLSERLDS